MKKRLICSVLILTMVLVLAPAAFAANELYLLVGENARQQLIRIPAEESYSADQVPPGMFIEEDPGAGSIGLYLSGSPVEPGCWNFSISSGDGQNAACTVNVEVPPYITSQSPDVSCTVDDSATLYVTVENPYNWALEYTWTMNGQPVRDSNTDTLRLDTSAPGEDVYRCSVYAWKNNRNVTLYTNDIRTSVKNGAPVITSVSVRSLPNRVEYYVGEFLDVRGLALNVDYSDGHSETVREAAIECIPYYFTQAGVQSVSARYGSGYTSFNVEVKEKKTVSKISVNTLPFKDTYRMGEMLDVTGLTLRVDYTDNTYMIVGLDKKVNCSPRAMNTAGEQKITVSYEDKTCEFMVAVVDPNRISGIGIRSLPEKTAYTVGDTLDLTGLVLEVESDGGNWTLSGSDSSVSVSPTVLETEGSQKVLVTYRVDNEEYKSEFSVFVAADAETAADPAPAPAKEPEARDEEPAEEKEPAPAEKNGILSYILIAAAAALAGGIVTWFFLRKKQ